MTAPVFDFGNALLDFVVRIVDVIMPADGYGLYMGNLPYNHFGSRHQFLAEVSVRYDQRADHSHPFSNQ